MDIQVQIRFFTENNSWLCFRHAVVTAYRGGDVKTEIDDFSSEYYMGPTTCDYCDEEETAVDKL